MSNERGWLLIVQYDPGERPNLYAMGEDEARKAFERIRNTGYDFDRWGGRHRHVDYCEIVKRVEGWGYNESGC